MKKSVNEACKVKKPILKGISGLSKNDYKILEFINCFDGDFFDYNIRDFAAEINISVASVSRFANKYGFKNYQALTIYINKSIQKFIDQYPISEDKNNNLSTIRSGIKYVFDNLYNQELLSATEQAASLINEANKIYVLGAGSSKRMSETLVSNLYKIAKNVISENDFHTFIPALACATKNDVFVLFSDNLNSPELFFCIEECHNRDVPIIFITSNNDASYLHNKDIAIVYQKIYSSNLNIPLSTKISQLMIADILFESILIENQELRVKLNEAIKLMDKWKKNKRNS
ncbi:MurR/RpiR family transcriptional regulator [Mycoplasma buteonis]|uniref:MurR/RpiR family transcriptional regulator n=1 Tax=Mycoplasma buteonis TaxID=171280 RepID=UPI00055B3FAC|nr:MurR/RpiR family transcriptional regulator [Mycoplasma buteonis]